MLRLKVIAACSLLHVAVAQDSNDSIPIVNLLNPFWALPDGENSTRGLGASVVNVVRPPQYDSSLEGGVERMLTISM